MGVRGGYRSALQAGRRGPLELPPGNSYRGARSALRTQMTISGDNDKPQPSLELARPEMREKPTVVIGAGPAGLTAGYLLTKLGLPVVVLEAEDQVGGIA